MSNETDIMSTDVSELLSLARALPGKAEMSNVEIYSPKMKAMADAKAVPVVDVPASFYPHPPKEPRGPRELNDNFQKTPRVAAEQAMFLEPKRLLDGWINEAKCTQAKCTQPLIQQSQEQLQILRQRFENSIEQYNQMI